MSSITHNNKEYLSKFIKKMAAEQHLKSFDIEIKTVPSDGSNFTSSLYKVKITSERKTLELFAKIGCMSENLRNQTVKSLYDVEYFFYTDLLKIYRQIEDKHNVSEKDILKSPEYYGAVPNYMNELIVLEDLTVKGFKSPDRFKAVDWTYATVAITELAKFHALSIAFQHENPTDFEKLAEVIPSKGILQENELNKIFFEKSASLAVKAVREENKEKFKCFLQNQDALSFNRLQALSGCKVIAHGDYKPNNIMYKSKEDGTVEVVPLDFQLLQIGSPISDLLYFIFTATDRAFRAKYYDKMISHYQSELAKALERFGLDIDCVFPKKKFEQELREKLPYGLIMSIFMLPINDDSEEQAPSLTNSSSLSVATGEQYTKRINEIVDDYIKFEVLLIVDLRRE